MFATLHFPLITCHVWFVTLASDGSGTCVPEPPKCAPTYPTLTRPSAHEWTNAVQVATPANISTIRTPAQSNLSCLEKDAKQFGMGLDLTVGSRNLKGQRELVEETPGLAQMSPF